MRELNCIKLRRKKIFMQTNFNEAFLNTFLDSGWPEKEVVWSNCICMRTLYWYEHEWGSTTNYVHCWILTKNNHRFELRRPFQYFLCFAEIWHFRNLKNLILKPPKLTTWKDKNQMRNSFDYKHKGKSPPRSHS